MAKRELDTPTTSTRALGRKPYQQPRLTSYGDLRRLTSGGRRGRSESGANPGVNTHI